MKAYQFLNGKSGVKYDFKDTTIFGNLSLENPEIYVHGFSYVEKDDLKNDLERKAKSELKSASGILEKEKNALKGHDGWNYRKFWSKSTRNNSSITGTGLLFGLAFGGIVGASKYFLGEDVGDAILWGVGWAAGINGLTQWRDEHTRKVNKKRINKSIEFLRIQRVKKQRIFGNVANSKIDFYLDKEASEFVEARLSLEKEDPSRDPDKVNKCLEKFYVDESSE